MNPTEQAQRKAISRIGVIWTLTPRLLEEYFTALRDIDPEALDAAITEANRTRVVRPTAAQLRELASTLRPGRARVNSIPTDEGRGCPQQGTGCRTVWMQASETLAYCRTHRIAWTGRLTQPTTTRTETGPGDDERGTHG